MTLEPSSGSADPFPPLMRVLLRPLGYQQLGQALVDAVPNAFAADTAVVGALLLTINAESHCLEAFTYTHGAHQDAIAAALAGQPRHLISGDYRRQTNLVEQVAVRQVGIGARHVHEFLSGYVDQVILDRLEQLIGWQDGLALPLLVQQRSAGVLLYALGKEIDTVSAAERERMTNFANLVGLAMEQARLYDLEQRRAHEAAALQAVLLRIATADDARAMLEEIITAALELLGADYAAVNTIPTRPGEQAWHVRRGYHSSATVQSTIYPPGTGLAGRAMAARAAVVVREFGVDPDFPLEEFPVHVAEHMHSGMGVPLLRPAMQSDDTGEAFGALVVGYRTPQRISRDQIDLAMALAQHAAVGLERARLLAVERTRARELEALVASGRRLSAEIDQGAVIRAITSAAAATLGALSATVAVVEWPSIGDHDPATARFEFGAWYQDEQWQRPDDTVRHWERTARRALETQEIQLVTSVPAGRLGQDLASKKLPPGGLIAFPIRSHGRVLAIGLLLGKREGGIFDADDTRMVRAFAEQAASALDNARLYEEERRTRRQVEEVHEQGEAFLRIVGHDLKTPLTNILGYAQLAQRLRGRFNVEATGAPQNIDERLRVACDKIVENCRRLQRLVDSLQEAFRLGSGQFELQWDQVDLTTLVRQVVEEQGAVAPDHAFTISAPPPPPAGQWDAERLRQVVANLVSNAIKYSPDGGPIAVTVQQRGAVALLTVVDHGLGIPAEHLPALFQPYSRLHQSRAIKGTGLGLYIVKGIVEAHGGSVHAHSGGEGAGATFTVTLPLQRASPGRGRPVPRPLLSGTVRAGVPPAIDLMSPPASP